LILLTGFGPFLDVRDNPSATLVQALDGARIAGFTVVAEVLDVSYQRAPARVVELAAIFEPVLVIGTGVASTRDEVQVERAGRGGPSEGMDVDGACPELRPGVYYSPVADALARALGVRLSSDAGRYVCNAWLYRVGRALNPPVGFVHIPPEGIPAAPFLNALGRVAEDLPL